VQKTRDGLAVTAFHKGERAGDFTDDQMVYANHHSRDLGRLHAIRRELNRNSITEIATADQTLRDEIPIFELDHEGRLMRLNGMAERLLLSHPDLILQHNRVLTVSGPQRQRFRTAVGEATDNRHALAGTVNLPQIRGTDGCILPPLRLNLLPQTIGGRRVLIIATTDRPRGITGAIRAPQEKVTLTPREHDILQGLIRGHRRDQLAYDLGITVPTVDLHSRNLRRKLGASTLLEAVANAYKYGVF
jgi:DNA-binding CsgD family transcriptional regulator